MIDEEMRLLNGAQAALRAGDAKHALSLLSEHAARFPNGKLSLARAVTRMLALCQAGRAEQARAEAQRFIAKYPSSPFVDRVRAICPAAGESR
jgi:outer membrane protein assembly factor BamD (BamD/ComL family)